MFDTTTSIDLTILMPCLNEEANIGSCIDEAMEYIHSHHLNGEVLIVDNNSTDQSAEIAVRHGAAVIPEPHRGYGCALRTGLQNARGTVIIFGDCDSTYDFLHLDPFYRPLMANQYDLIMGNRFSGLMEAGAMPLSHRRGVPFLSFCGRLRYGVAVHDFHCGIRGIRNDALQKLTFHTTGMEFATEILAEAGRKNLRIGEVSVPLRKAASNRKVKLRTIRDGLRHLWYILSNTR